MTRQHTASTFYTRHRGPFRLLALREAPRRKSGVKQELLSGTLDGEDVEAEARALLEDPRDTIVLITVWSVREECFVTTFSRTDRIGLDRIGLDEQPRDPNDRCQWTPDCVYRFAHGGECRRKETTR